jgi:Family of unknown function (DUF6318)
MVGPTAARGAIRLCLDLCIVGLVVLAPIGACGGGDGSKPSGLPPLTSAASSSSGPGPVTTSPSAQGKARAKTPAGASAFTRFYIGLINDAYRTGVSEPLRRYAGPRCDSCTSIAAAVDDIYDRGGQAEGGRLYVKRVAATGIRSTSQATVVVDIAVSPYRQIDGSGRVVDQVAARQTVLLVDLEWSNGVWRIKGIRDQRSDAS